MPACPHAVFKSTSCSISGGTEVLGLMGSAVPHPSFQQVQALLRHCSVLPFPRGVYLLTLFSCVGLSWGLAAYFILIRLSVCLQQLYMLIRRMFAEMPLAAVVAETTLILHGGKEYDGPLWSYRLCMSKLQLQALLIT